MRNVHETVDGPIAGYNDRQRQILRGELVGLIAFTVMALVGVIVISVWQGETRATEGFRAEYEYNYAGVQKVNFLQYLTSKNITPTQISPEAAAAYGVWAAANPKTKNVQVLTKYLGAKYEDTAAIFGYMSQYVTTGLGQSCEYCHNLADFSADEKPTKLNARNMFVMMFEVQNKWVESIPRPEGQVIYQLQCASCHNGVAKFWNKDLKAKSQESFGVAGGGMPYDYTFADERFLGSLPDADGRVNYFQVIADRTTPPGLNDTARNQNAMYHMNTALGVGCDFCHYGGYFRSYSLPDGTYKYPKAQARHMLGMLQDLTVNWLPQLPPLDANSVAAPDQAVAPNCYMCHRGYVVPPGDIAPTEPIQKVAAPLLAPLQDIPIPISVLPKP